MLTNPKYLTPCRIHYRASLAVFMPWEGAVGFIAGVGRGRPRNHRVLFKWGDRYERMEAVVPAGNLFKVEQK